MNRVSPLHSARRPGRHSARRPGRHSARRPGAAPARLLRRAAGVLGAVAVLAAAVLMTGAPGGAAAVNGCTVAVATSDPAACAGSQGSDTTLPATSSAVTVPEPNNGTGTPFPNLQVTVNQTKNLVNQDVSVSWTGATATTGTTGSNFTGDYLQIFECWGAADPTGTSGATDPGPPPSQCEFGGESSTPTSSYPIPSDDNGFQYSRVLSQSSWGSYAQLNQCSIPGQTCAIPGYSNVYTDTTDGLVIEPFQAVDGTTVDQQANYGFDENPLAPTVVLAQPLLQLRHHQRDRLRPLVPRSDQSDQRHRSGAVPGRHRPRGAGPGLRPGHRAGQRWGHHHPPVLAGRGAPEHPGPSRTRTVPAATRATSTRSRWSHRRSPPRPGPTASPSR